MTDPVRLTPVVVALRPRYGAPQVVALQPEERRVMYEQWPSNPLTPAIVQDIATNFRRWGLVSWRFYPIDNTYTIRLRRATAHFELTINLDLIEALGTSTLAAFIEDKADLTLLSAPRCNGCHCHSPEIIGEPDPDDPLR